MSGAILIVHLRWSSYDTGHSQKLFVSNAAGGEFVGKVWPGYAVFPDYFHPQAAAYWQSLIRTFLTGVPVDGLWCGTSSTTAHGEWGKRQVNGGCGVGCRYERSVEFLRRPVHQQ
jgi:hypothetical protein